MFSLRPTTASRSPFARGLPALLVAILPGAGFLTGCGGGGPDGTETVYSATPPPAYEVSVQVLDEEEVAIEGARWRLMPATPPVEGPAIPSFEAETPLAGETNAEGVFHLEGLRDAVLLLVEAEDHLPEPVVIDREDTESPMQVRLWRRRGRGGERRIVLHFAGDAMMGRRYIEPTSDDTAVVIPGDGGASASGLVAAVAPLFRCSDVRSVNLETVLGTLPDTLAYPGKRWLLQSPPETTHLLDELEVSLVTLGNNHLRDWLEQGVISTLQILEDAGIPYVGAGVTETEASLPLELTVAGYRVGFLSYTTVNGDYVNDRLPDDDEPEPVDLDPDDAWQYEYRRFEFLSPSIGIPEGFRRIGTFWSLYEELEDRDEPPPEAELVDLWTRAARIYPELQDWVARRGHGGANFLVRSRMEEDIGLLRNRDCDLVVVQLHAGYQFSEAKSSWLERVAHDAIDAGADLVVGHHPHVLQGFEWYREKLIAYSLGNFLFDQNFLVTFASTVLRVIYEEGSILEARVLPVVLDRYRPVPLGGGEALRVIRALHERSVLPLHSERVQGVVRNVVAEPADGTSPLRLTRVGSSARIERGAADTRALVLDLAEGAVTDLVLPVLTRSRGPGAAALDGVLLGRDLLEWGRFEDSVADGESRGGTHWEVDGRDEAVRVADELPSGVRCLHLERTARNSHRVLSRLVARIPIPRHRLFRKEDGAAQPADGMPRYSARLWARLAGTGQPLLRLDVYHFDDSDPTRNPESDLLRSVEIPFELPGEGEWYEVVADIDSTAFSEADGLEANAVLLYVGLAPPKGGTSMLQLDDVQFLEWRTAMELPDAFYAVDAVRSDEPGGVAITLEQTAE